MIKISEIYQKLSVVLPSNDMGHHYSDLYCRVTHDSMDIVHRYEYRRQVTTFTDQITGALWYEIPFAYPGKRDK